MDRIQYIFEVKIVYSSFGHALKFHQKGQTNKHLCKRNLLSNFIVLLHSVISPLAYSSAFLCLQMNAYFRTNAYCLHFIIIYFISMCRKYNIYSTFAEQTESIAIARICSPFNMPLMQLAKHTLTQSASTRIYIFLHKFRSPYHLMLCSATAASMLVRVICNRYGSSRLQLPSSTLKVYREI